jgi:ubiquinone/menaquinone biosynthesis C-methylase UbiE
VRRMLRDMRGARVLDVPCGTGRFFPLYQRLGMRVTGVDSSWDMIQLADARTESCVEELAVGDAARLAYRDRSFDVVVMVRMLHLVRWAAARRMLGQACRVARSRVIVTAQLGRQARTGSNTATHRLDQFLALVSDLSWRVAEDRRVTGVGWHVMRLEKD